MKTITIVLCTLYLASYAVVRGDDDERFSCLKKAGLTPAFTGMVYGLLPPHNGDMPALFLDNSEEGIKKRGCIEACVMQKIGIMNGNTIEMQKVDEHIDRVLGDNENKEPLRESIHQCADAAANDDECLVAQSFAKCGLEQVKLGLRQMMGIVAS